MHIFVSENNKGGVGKTKTCAMVAEYAAKFLKKRTLLIDFDPQCNLSRNYIDMETDPSSEDEGFVPPIHPDFDQENDKAWDGRSSIADIFYDNFTETGLRPYPTSIENLEIAPASAKKLLLAEQVRRSEVKKLIYSRLRDLLRSQDFEKEYDFVVIDTAPSKGPLTISAMHAATHLLIPSVMEEASIQGVYGIMQLWKQEQIIRSEDDQLHIVGILANMFQANTALHAQIYEALKKSAAIGKFVLDEKLGRRISFAEIEAAGTGKNSIFDLPSSSEARKEAIAVSKSITDRIF